MTRICMQWQLSRFTCVPPGTWHVQCMQQCWLSHWRSCCCGNFGGCAEVAELCRWRWKSPCCFRQSCALWMSPERTSGPSSIMWACSLLPLLPRYLPLDNRGLIIYTASHLMPHYDTYTPTFDHWSVWRPLFPEQIGFVLVETCCDIHLVNKKNPTTERYYLQQVRQCL